MTKYEWERQLKKGISSLPKSEQQRALDYYNELFADKIDAGMREQYIIAEFGNPYDVANKILTDYYTEGKKTEEVDAYVYTPVDEMDEDFEEPRTVKTYEREPATDEPQTKAKENAQQTVDKNKGHIRFVAVENDAQPQSRQGRSLRTYGLPSLACVLVFFILGAFFNMWHPGWMVFLLIPVIESLIQAVYRRNFRIFAYPVFITFVYLLLGFYCHMWHPMWVLFITIPVYYMVGSAISHSKNGKSKDAVKDESKKEEKPEQKAEEPVQADVKKPRKSRKIWVTTAIVLLVVAIIGVIIFGFGRMLWRRYANSEPRTATVSASVSDEAKFNLTSITVHSETYSVEIAASASDDLSVKYSELRRGETIDVSEVPYGGGVQIQINQLTSFFFDAIENGAPCIVIEIPVGFVPEVTLDLDAGKISASHLEFSDLHCATDAGAIVLDNVKCNNLKASSSMGAVAVTNSTVSGEAIVSSNMGEVRYEGQAGKLELSTNMGAVNFAVTSDDIFAETNMGAVNGTVYGVKAYYDIDAKCDMGNSNLTDQTVNQGKKLRVETNMGDITVNFQ